MADDARWMSYRELSQARGTSVHAAVVLTRRRKWPRQNGNDGTVRVLVPEGYDQPAGASEVVEKTDTEALAAFRLAVDRLAEAYAEARAMAQQQIKQAQDEALALRGRVEELEGIRDAERRRGRWSRAWAAWRG